MAMKAGEIYQNKEGVLVEVLNGASSCELQCCGEALGKLEEKTADAATEKHVPVIEKIDGGYRVKVGSVPHPMEEDHLIEWIELRAGNRIYKAFLSPGQAPEAVFLVDADVVCAREHCNKHGLWKG